jgi:hypothetical protein
VGFFTAAAVGVAGFFNDELFVNSTAGRAGGTGFGSVPLVSKLVPCPDACRSRLDLELSLGGILEFFSWRVAALGGEKVDAVNETCWLLGIRTMSRILMSSSFSRASGSRKEP